LLYEVIQYNTTPEGASKGKALFINSCSRTPPPPYKLYLYSTGQTYYDDIKAFNLVTILLCGPVLWNDSRFEGRWKIHKGTFLGMRDEGEGLLLRFDKVGMVKLLLSMRRLTTTGQI
jgi:hypothetical protein